VVQSASFTLEARTAIEDAGGRMKDLLRLGRKTLERPNESGTPAGVGTLEWRGKSSSRGGGRSSSTPTARRSA
jgi:hypothetical protein